MGLAAGVPRSRLLSARAKLRLARLPLELWRHRKVLDPLRPELAAELDGEDLASWARRCVGDEVLEYVLGPAFSSTFDSDPEQLSGAFALLALRFVASGFRLQCFEGGIGPADAHARRAPLGAPRLAATSVETDGGGARVRYVAPSGERTREADAVVVAVPGVLVPGLCPKLTPAERAFFESVHYARGAIVFLLFDEAPATLPYYGVAFPRREGLDLYGLAVDHWKPGVAPPGAGLVNAALTESAAARLAGASDGAVVDCVLESLARTPIGRLAPRDARGTPLGPDAPAVPRRLPAGASPASCARHDRSPRLAFAGDYLVGPYTEAALTSGLRAATQLSRELQEGVWP